MTFMKCSNIIKSPKDDELDHFGDFMREEDGKVNLIARENEIKLLNHALNKSESQFIAVYGRRRIGKTYLVREVFADSFCFSHTGYYNLPKEAQLSGFFKSLQKAGLSAYGESPGTWMDAFDMLETIIDQSQSEKKILFLDEISWMDTPRCDLIPALEHFWNSFASARKDVILIICSSATSWVLDHVFHNKGGLHNRLTLSLHLQPFTLSEVEKYVYALGVQMSRMQILEGYMALGGIPYYWSHLERGMSIEQYIDYLFFRKGAVLKDEFTYLFDSLFRFPEVYVRIIHALTEKRKGLTRNELLSATGLTSAGGVSQKLEELENCDFIRSYPSYGKRKEKLYQLIDPFVLFYYHFIEHRSFDPQFWMHQANTPKTNVWKGLAFELICLLHVQEIKEKLGIGSVLTEVFSFSVQEDPEKGIHGSQIDLIIKRADRITNLVEMKYAQDEYLITKAVDESIRRKRSDYLRATKTKHAIQTTLIAPYGVVQNAYAANLDSVLDAEDLF